MKIEENYIEKLCNTVAKTLVEAFERLTIDDVNMYQLGYNKGIDDFEKSLIGNSRTEVIDGKITLIVTEKRIKLIAEQLKEGGKCLL